MPLEERYVVVDGADRSLARQALREQRLRGRSSASCQRLTRRAAPRLRKVAERAVRSQRGAHDGEGGRRHALIFAAGGRESPALLLPEQSALSSALWPPTASLFEAALTAPSSAPQTWGMYLLAAFCVMMLFYPMYLQWKDPTIYGQKVRLALCLTGAAHPRCSCRCAPAPAAAPAAAAAAPAPAPPPPRPAAAPPPPSAHSLG